MKRGIKRELTCLTGLAALLCHVSGRRAKTTTMLAAGALALVSWPATRRTFRNRVVVIAGGSRGLGLALAEAFLAEGARVALLARDETELEKVPARFGEAGSGRVLTIACDVTRSDEIHSAIQQVEQHYGGVDILVNNAGAIGIGPFECMNRGDFESMLELCVHAVVEGTQAVLPVFRRQGRGHVVNISSIGGRMAVPHMSTYCAAKFALSGLSRTLAAELGAEGFGVTTVYPGIMRAGSPVHAHFKGDPEREYAWFATASETRCLSVSVEDAARRIVDAVAHGDSELTFPCMARIAALAQAGLPETTSRVRAFVAGLLPRGTVTEYRSGENSREWADQQLWHKRFGKRGDRSGARWNEHAASPKPPG